MYMLFAIVIGSVITHARTREHAQEVTCSKFEYELQTLRTVLKIEFEMSLMEKKMKEWQINMEASAERYNAIEVKREAKMEELVATISKLKQDTVEQAKALEQTNRVALDMFERRLTEMSTNVSNQITASNKGNQQVAFTVHTPTGALVDRVPIFTTVVLNLGNGYNQDTGKFSCPTAGLYQFAVTLLAKYSRSGSMYCALQKNGALVAHVYSHEGIHDSASVVVAVHMSVGDFFDMKCTNWHNNNKSSYNVFTGMLVQAD